MEERILRLEEACEIKILRVAFVQGDGTQENPSWLMWRFYLPDGRYIGEIPAGCPVPEPCMFRPEYD